MILKIHLFDKPFILWKKKWLQLKNEETDSEFDDHFSVVNEKGRNAAATTTKSYKTKFRSYPLRIVASKQDRIKMQTFFQKDLMPYVGHARHLLEIAMRWYQHHYDIAHEEKDFALPLSQQGKRERSIAEIELSVALSHVASCLSLEASLLFSIHELEMWSKQDEETTFTSDTIKNENGSNRKVVTSPSDQLSASLTKDMFGKH